MKKFLRFLRRYPLSLLALGVIVFLTLYKPSVNVPVFPGLDKMAHFLMYASLCSIILFEYYRSHTRPDKNRIFWFAIVLPVLFSGVMELLQGLFTKYRSGDFADFLSNALGVVFAALLGSIYKKRGR